MEGDSFYGSATLHHKESGVPVLPNFGGFLSVHAYTLCHRITKFDVVTRGEDVYLEIIHASHLNRVKFQSSPIFMYLFPNPLTQDDQIPHGNTSGEEHVG